MANPWPATVARGARSGIELILDDANPEATLTLTMCDSPQFSGERPTFCLCYPGGSSATDLPDAVAPEVEVESGVVTVTIDREQLLGAGWPSLWDFAVYHEAGTTGTESEPPPLLLLSSGTILLPDDQPPNVVCDVEVS